MTNQERAELDDLKGRLESLRREFELLTMRTRQLEARLRLDEQRAPMTPISAEAMEISPLPVTPLETPRVLETAEAHGVSLVERPKPPPLPPILAPAPAIAKAVGEPRATRERTRAEAMDPPKSIQPPPAIATAAVGPEEEASLEMRVGTYWLVRVGIVMLLTALVFFGNYAYQKFITGLGPAGKLALMYLGGGLLLGLGAWLQRGKESLRNYAQVLFAGGLAAVYFTTYAAHHVPNLRVIESPVLDGLLLLAWAGFMAFLADRRKSELLSLFAIGLAYYTSVITNIGLVTLYSNFVLTAAAVFFLVRNRWATLSHLSLGATYFAYAYWRYFHDGAWLWSDRETALANFWPGNLFLLGYWILFTAAAFLSRHDKLTGVNRAVFVTTNNGALFMLVTMSLYQTYRDSFWMFALGFGAALLCLSLAARRFLAGERVVADNYLTQGLLLVTVGFIAKLSGLQLALVLAAQSVVLFILSQQQGNLVLRVGAFISAPLALLWCVDGMERSDSPGLYLGAGIGLLFAFNAWWSRRHDAEANATLIRPQTGYFAALALLAWFLTTWKNTSPENFPLVLAIEAAALTASIYWGRLREMTLLSQGYLLLGQFLWISGTLSGELSVPWWNAASLIAISVAFGHWWQRQTILNVDLNGRHFVQAIYSLAAVGLIHAWLQPQFTAEHWLAFTSLLAIALTAYAALTRQWFLAAAGQLFIVASGWEFIRQLADGEPPWFLSLAPLSALALLSTTTVVWFNQRAAADAKLREPLLFLAMVYRWAAILMAVAWVHEYIPGRERFWVLALVGAAAFGWAGWRKNREALAASAIFAAAGFWHFWSRSWSESVVYLPNLLAILLLLGQQQFSRRSPERFAIDPAWHTMMILAGGVSLWRFTSKWVVFLQSGGFYLTASWAVLAFALFVAGLLLRERMHRWVGLAVLACAVGRVVILDVWRLETIYRILSFFALGVVLLALGFLYNKFQEKIKAWL